MICWTMYSVNATVPVEGDSSMAAEKTDNQSPAINELNNMQRNQN